MNKETKAEKRRNKLPKTMIRIATADTVDRDLARWMAGIARRYPALDIDIRVSPHGDAEARNGLIREFLASNLEKLWIISSDVIPPPNVDLLRHDFPIVCGIYDTFHPRFGAWPKVYKKDPDGRYAMYTPDLWPSFDQPFAADAAGAGCMVISRSVVEKKEGPWFYYTDQPDYINFAADNGGVHVSPACVCAHIRKLNLGDIREISAKAVQFDNLQQNAEQKIKEKEAGLGAGEALTEGGIVVRN